MPRSRPLQKVDGRSLEARRLKAIAAGITGEHAREIQAAILKRNAASLALEAERLECMQRNGEVIDADLLVRISNALARALGEMRDVQPKPGTSAAEKEAAAERAAYLSTLTEAELLELREAAGGGVPIVPVQPVSLDYLPAHLSAESLARARDAQAQWARDQEVRRIEKESVTYAADAQAELDERRLESLIEILK